MSRRPRATFPLLVLLLLLMASTLLAARAETPYVAEKLTSPSAVPPPEGAPWQAVSLPDFARRAPGAARSMPSWFRIRFDGSADLQEPAAIYRPYLYGGGDFWLNGVHVATVPGSTDRLRVRWERPHLLQLPASAVRAGRNELLVRALPTIDDNGLRFPRVMLGPLAELDGVHDRRMFWARTAPQATVVACLIASLFVLFIWWRRPGEVLYGLFGLATAFWGIRTLTFVIEEVPVDRWQAWRLVYLFATGGFVVVMAFFALRIAVLRQRWLERGLLLYWIAGPLALLLLGAGEENAINRLWTGGLIPVGIGIVAVSFWTVWRQRTWASAVMPAALCVAVLAGVHDYLISWNIGSLWRWMPDWPGQRLFLLHHGANLLLLAMGVLLSLRFIRALESLEQLNESLESRVADRERSLAENFTRMAALERQNAASSERQQIMREIHDGLGSRLFTALSRVERGDMDDAQIAEALRACIADMRLALDALAPDDHDLRTAFGDFLFRWQTELDTAGVHPAWTIDMPEDAPGVAPHTTLQILRVAQEALTNVVKHARAGQVHLRLRQRDGTLRLEIEDDGSGFAPEPRRDGRGLLNMRARAHQLGGQLEIRNDTRGTCIRLTVPLAPTTS
ncbi:MAG: ATP-binding protein [Gammaproteobacteria bacterium]|nr:ATP-binding protein [Gammaproteobacteria bacterium]MBU1440994.1 ATP-binding protein [Gammaproteobacteria bacterium]